MLRAALGFWRMRSVRSALAEPFTYHTFGILDADLGIRELSSKLRGLCGDDLGIRNIGQRGFDFRPVGVSRRDCCWSSTAEGFFLRLLVTKQFSKCAIVDGRVDLLWSHICAVVVSACARLITGDNRNLGIFGRRGDISVPFGKYTTGFVPLARASV